MNRISRRLGAVLAAAIITISFGGVAVAQDEKAAGSGPNPFTDCGIGAALFPNTHWAAVTSNVIWDVGTTAVISATASPETCQGKSAAAARFINDTYENVIEETAKGEGEHLVALLEIYSCDAAVHDELIGELRREMAPRVSDAGYTDQSHLDKAKQYFEVIDTTVTESYGPSCSA